MEDLGYAEGVLLNLGIGRFGELGIGVLTDWRIEGWGFPNWDIRAVVKLCVLIIITFTFGKSISISNIHWIGP